MEAERGEESPGEEEEEAIMWEVRKEEGREVESVGPASDEEREPVEPPSWEALPSIGMGAVEAAEGGAVW